MYIKKYYKWTEKLGYFKSMGITALVLFTVVGIAMIIGVLLMMIVIVRMESMEMEI